MKNENNKGKNKQITIQETPQVRKINDFPNTFPYAELSLPKQKGNKKQSQSKQRCSGGW